jgi:hypothetical protein
MSPYDDPAVSAGEIADYLYFPIPMPKPELPDLTDGKRQTVTKEVAARIVKDRAYAVFIQSEFGSVRVFKYVMLDFLESLTAETVEVRKVPKFATYYFYRA